MMLYEFRIYYANPGKYPEVRARFENHAMRLFPKMGIKVVDYWEAADGKEELYYICEYTNMEARDKAWERFEQDPEWQEIKTKSHENGVLLKNVDSYFMKRSPLPR